MVVFKELNFNCFPFQKVMVVLTISESLGECGSLERTHF